VTSGPPAGRGPRRSAGRPLTTALLVTTVVLAACGGRSDADVVEDLVNRLLDEQVVALRLAMDTWDGSGDPLSPAVEDQLESVLAGRALERARVALPAAVADPEAAGLPSDPTQTEAHRFDIERIVRSESACVVAVGQYAFGGLDAEDATPLPTAVSLTAIGPDGSLGERRDWRLRDAISVASLEDEDLDDPQLLDTTCTWDR
jgi:hypothetical protein